MSETNERLSINEMMEGKTKQVRDRKNWVGFVEGEVVNFMQLNDLEKISMDDGTGNKAKLTRRKDGSIFVESTSSTLL